MALLHYQNVEPNIHRPDKLMIKTVSGLRDLEHTKKYLESDDAVLRLAWKLRPSDNTKGCWVELSEAEDRPDEPEKTFQAFLDDSSHIELLPRTGKIIA